MEIKSKSQGKLPTSISIMLLATAISLGPLCLSLFGIYQALSLRYPLPLARFSWFHGKSFFVQCSTYLLAIRWTFFELGNKLNGNPVDWFNLPKKESNNEWIVWIVVPFSALQKLPIKHLCASLKSNFYSISRTQRIAYAREIKRERSPFLPSLNCIQQQIAPIQRLDTDW